MFPLDAPAHLVVKPFIIFDALKAENRDHLVGPGIIAAEEDVLRLHQLLQNTKNVGRGRGVVS